MEGGGSRFGSFHCVARVLGLYLLPSISEWVPSDITPYLLFNPPLIIDDDNEGTILICGFLNADEIVYTHHTRASITIHLYNRLTNQWSEPSTPIKVSDRQASVAIISGRVMITHVFPFKPVVQYIRYECWDPQQRHWCRSLADLNYGWIMATSRSHVAMEWYDGAIVHDKFFLS